MKTMINKEIIIRVPITSRYTMDQTMIDNINYIWRMPLSDCVLQKYKLQVKLYCKLCQSNVCTIPAVRFPVSLKSPRRIPLHLCPSEHVLQ